MTSKEIENKEKPARRKVTRPLGTPVDRLAITNKQAGLHYCWVKEFDVPEYEDAGYDYLDRKGPEKVAAEDMTGTSGGLGSKVSTLGDRQGLRLFAMCIPQEEWERQQALRDKESDEPLEAIRRGEAYQFKGEYKPKGK